VILLAKRIQIITPATGKVAAELIEKNPKTEEAIWNALPIEGKANRWGDEIYFSIPVNVGLEEGQEVVSVGDVAYWPPGKAFCIFFGPTPASRGNEPRAYSPVNVFAKIVGDASIFKKVKNGEEIRVEEMV
jgi:hypothetical protein